MEDHSARPGYKTRWLGLLFIGISVVVISLDNTVLNTAIPSISRDLSASTTELQWVLDGYILVFAALLLTTGSLGDRFGRKKMLQLGLIWFAVGSALAGFVNSIGFLIALRAIMGIGGALILPATLSIITATFPHEERPQAIAIWAAIFGLGVGIGPVLGGFLLERYHWSSVFLVNLPICLIALVGGAFFLAESRDEFAPAIDYPGVILSILGLFAVVYGIIEAGVRGWTDATVIGALVVGLVVLAIFGWWENRSPNAMLPMHFFRNMSFTGASVALSIVTFCQFSILFFLSPYLQTVQGYSTLQGGLRVLPLAITITIAASLSARVSNRLGTKYTVALGIGIAAASLLFMATQFTVSSPDWQIFAPQIALGLGVGIAFSPATNSIMGSVPISKAGVGSAMNDTTRQLGGALGVAVLGAVMNLSYTNVVSALHTSLPSLPADALEQIASSVQAAHIVAGTLPQDAANTVISVANSAYVIGMSHAMFVGAVVLALAALFALIVLPNRVIRHYESALSATSVGVKPRENLTAGK